MMVQRIAGDVYKIVADGNVYVYLKPEIIVIDTSDSRNREVVKREVEGLVPLDEVKKILLTHLHFDHCGNLDLFPGAKIYASKENLDNFRKNSDDFFLESVSSKTKEMLESASELDNSISGLKVLKVPGHTSGCVAFLDEEKKLLFSGDTLFFNGVGRTDFDNSMPEEMEESIRRLVKLVRDEGYKLCPGHDY